MSIEFPLFRALAILPHSCSTGSSGRCAQVAFQTRNVGSAELNQKICRSSFPKKVELKSFWGWVTGPSNLHKQFRFGFRRSTVKTLAAAEYSASDGSSESGGIEKKELLKLSMTMFNEANEIRESKLGITDGPEIEDGDGQGGNGQGGDGLGKNNGDFGGSEGSGDDLLRGLEWWWWWQWKRAHIRSHTGLRQSCSEPLWLADSMAQVIEAETMRSLGPAVLAIDELVRLLALDQMVTFVLMLPFIVPLLFEIHDEVAQMTNMTIAAVFALLTVASLAVMYWLLFSWRNCDNNGNDSDDDNGDQ